MSHIKFFIDGERFSVDSNKIPEDSYLDILLRTELTTEEDNIQIKTSTFDDGSRERVIYTDDPEISKELIVAINYLNNNYGEIVTDIGNANILSYYGVYSYEDDLLKVIDYLNSEMIPVGNKTFRDILIKYEVYPYTSYENVFEREMYLRDNMYKQGYEDDNINTDPYYNLIKVTENVWRDFNYKLGNIFLNERNVLFTRVKRTRKEEWNNIQDKLKIIDHIFDISESFFVAGGFIYSILFGTDTHDVDIFFTETNEDEAIESLREYFDNEMEKDEYFKVKKDRSSWEKDFSSRIIRTNHTINFVPGKDYEDKSLNRSLNEFSSKLYKQFILRLYKTPSEVLHGFDVDCCCMGYDGKDIWMTERCIYALFNRYNTYNFELMSPSYEYRLGKYALRGMSLKIPGFERTRVKDVKFTSEFIEAHLSGSSLKIFNDEMWKNVFACDGEKTEGLDLLILLDKYYRDPLVSEEDKKELKACGYISDYIYSVDFSESPKLFWGIEDITKEYNKKFGDLPTLDESSTIYGIDSSYESSTNSEDKMEKYNNIYIGNVPYYDANFIGIYKKKDIDFIFNMGELYELLTDMKVKSLDIDDELYHFDINISKEIEFKVINPGEQTTSTFQRKILEDERSFFRDVKFYKDENKESDLVSHLRRTLRLDQ